MTPRVVSLLPAATEIVAALGLADRLVGRSHECDHPPELARLPVLTASAIDAGGSSGAVHRAVAARVRRALAVYRVDERALAALAPDVILTQTLCAVCGVGPADVAAYVETLSPGTRVVALEASDLAGVFADMAHVATACGAAERAPGLVAALTARLDAVRRAVAPAVADRPRPRVACLEWLDPPMAAGNWTPELVAHAGGTAVLAAPGRHSGTITWDALAAADPDAIIVAPCSFPLARTRTELGARTSDPTWSALRAVRTGAVHLADGNRYFNRPGPRLVDTAEIIAEMLHPTRAAYGHRGDAWVPL